MPIEGRFVVRDGAVQCDDAVGWLQPTPHARPDAAIAERLRRAQVAEFVDGDPAAAEQQFDELTGPGGPTGEEALPVLAAAAWQAQRSGRDERANAFAARLGAALLAMSPAAMADRRLAETAVAAALLDRTRGAPAVFRERLLPAIDPSLAIPALARLGELGDDTRPLAAALERTGARRDVLRRAAEWLPANDTAAGCTAHGDRLLAWFPGPGPGEGTGAVVPRSWLESLRASATTGAAADLPPLPRRGDLRFGDDADDGEPVLPGITATAAQLPAPPWVTRPAATVAAGALLVAVFAASALLTLRGARRTLLATRARADFLTGVTHELKTPVAAIRLMTDVLTSDEVPPGKQREYFALLAAEATRLSMLIDNVLDLGQMERGERAYDLRPGDLHDAVADAIAAFRPLADQAALRLELRPAAPQPPAPAPATFDRGAIVQALLAVLENARKYAAHGARIDVTSVVAGGRLVVRVRDHGPGVPTAERERIFARFERGSAHRHGSIPGIGLGLHIARSVVERHGGTLVCEAPPEGPGAEFVFTLPLAPATAP